MTTPRPARLPVVGALAALVVALFVGAPAAPATAAPSTPAPVGFTDDFYFPLAHPVRVADTRTGGGRLQGGEARNFPLDPMYDAGRPGSSPQSAGVVVLNVTVVDPSAAGHMIVGNRNTPGYPQPDYGQLQQSNLNWSPGQTVAGSVFVGTGSSGGISVWISAGTADVVVDASGFFPFDSLSGTPTTRTHYLPLKTPDRLYDTRTADGPLAPGEARVLDLGLPSGAIGREQVLAASVTVTVTNPTAAGSLTAWDGVGAPPGVSTLNFTAGRTVANSALVPVACVVVGSDPCGDLSLGLAVSPGAAADVVVDVTGYYRLDPRADFLGYYPLSGKRIGDSRTSSGNPPRLGAGQTALVDVSGYTATYLSDALAAHLTVTAVGPTAPTFFTAYTGGSRPDSSFSAASPGGDTAATVQTRLVDKRFRLYNNSGRVDVVVDVNGVYLVSRYVQDPTAVGRDGSRFMTTNTRVADRRIP